MKIENGKLKTAENMTPARRYSFLVGKDEPCHTAIERFRDYIDSRSTYPSLDDLENAFSVEAVTKEFFDLYCDKYIDLRNYLESNEDFVTEAKLHNYTSTQYAKKLMGQIVFLYFLQKKGWLGVKAWSKTLTASEYKNAYFARGAKSREMIPLLYSQADENTYRLSPSAVRSLSEEDQVFLSTCVKGEAWGSGPHNFMRKLFEEATRRGANFFDDYLEPLFYDALNVNRNEQGYYDPALHCRIPFLSGGLFEPIDKNWKYNKFSIPNELFSNKKDDNDRTANGILDIFDRYNFTMSEDEPMEREVAIDPEMLGKVFENLLDITDRKSKGAFYTPREIVHYMCQESLINYLTNAMGVKEMAIRDFILYGDMMKDEDANVLNRAQYQGNSYDLWISEELYLLDENGNIVVDRMGEMDKALQDVRIADPAVGSGAFPLGMLNEIVRARQNITTYMGLTLKIREPIMGKSILMSLYQNDRAARRLKYETIRNCIFAADIEPSAVDIAQLRLWLSLVIDDDINPNAKSELEGSPNPRPLPNLECNILCGNSLVDEFEGMKLINESDIIATAGNEMQFNMFQNAFDMYLEKLIAKQKELYECTDTEKKKQLLLDIDTIKDAIIMSQLQTTLSAEQLERYRTSKEMVSKPFVLWQLDFAKVFREKGGFDIVIGNPPYFNVETLGANNPMTTILKKNYKDIWMDKSDILFYFIYLGIKITNKQVNYITSNAYLFSDKGKKLRNYLLQHAPIRKLINFEKYQVFLSASITSCISFFDSQYKGLTFAKTIRNQAINIRDILYSQDSFIPIEFGLDSVFTIADKSVTDLCKKIDAEHPKLGGLFVIGEGMQTAANEIYTIPDNMPFAVPDQFVRWRVAGKNVHKYYLSSLEEKLLYVEDVELFEDLPAEIQNYLLANKEKLAGRADKKRRKTAKWWTYTFPLHKEYYSLNKIWTSYRGKENCFAFDDSNNKIGFTNMTVIFDTCSDVDIKYLLALLNSELYEFRYKHLAKQTGGGIYEYFANSIEKLPVPVIPKDQQKQYTKLVDRIIESGIRGDKHEYQQLQKTVNEMVYDLFSITKQERTCIKDFLTFSE